MADVDRQFQAAVDLVRSLPKKGAYQPSYETMLKFYGYFKQAKQGPCNESKPGFWDVVKKAKWEAWSSLGSMSPVEAMGCYVKEIKMVMETMPNNEEMADFSLVLKSFYETVYEPIGEEPPNMLRIFKKPVMENGNTKMEKHNGHSGDETIMEEEEGNIQEQLQSTDIHLNGFYSNGHDTSKHDVKQEDYDIVVVEKDKDNDSNNSHLAQDAPLSNDLEENHIAADNLFIVEVSSPKKGLPIEGKDSDDLPIQQDSNSVSTFPGTNGKENFEAVSSASDDSDEEFCDSIDPEHLSIIETEAAPLNGIPDESNGLLNSSQDHSLTNDVANEVSSNHERFTSTPFHKKPAHVTFNTEKKKSNKNGESAVGRQNGGILKIGKQAGSGYGGGDAKRSSGKQIDGGTHPQSRQQSSRLQDDMGITSSHDQLAASGTAGHSDSDSDDTNHNCESCDSSAERDEINERIVTALERIQHDMNRVLRRLETMEDVMALRQEQHHSVNRFQRRDQAMPWWSQFLPSKTVAFLILWPFVINLIFYYLRRRKARKC